MPIFNDTLQTLSVDGSQYGFSGTRIEDLGAAEYTLVTIAADVSGSVSSFKLEIEKCIQEIVRACRRSPRADNLMLRLVAFDSSIEEVHGFKPLTECPPDAYRGSLRAGGTTALYDASHNAIGAMTTYGRRLTDHDFDVNAILFVITDGADNASTQTAREVAKSIGAAVTGEHVESMVTILVGVNVQAAQISTYLMDFSAKAGFTQYVELGDANAATLARLADFASRSIAVQSASLGTSAPSQSLTF